MSSSVGSIPADGSSDGSSRGTYVSPCDGIEPMGGPMGCPMGQFIYRAISYWTYHGSVWHMYGMHHGSSRGLSRGMVSVHGNEPMGRPMGWVVFHGPSPGMVSKPWASP